MTIFPSQLALQLSHISAQNEASLHIAVWQTAIRITEAFPLFGIGLSYQAYLIAQESFRVPAQIIFAVDPNNSYLQWGAMAGIPVMLVFLSLMGYEFWFSWRNWQMAEIRYRPVLGGGIAALISLSISSLSGSGWTSPNGTASLGWLMMGVIASPVLRSYLREASQQKLSGVVMRSGKDMLSKYARHVWCTIQVKLFPPAPITGPTRVCVITQKFPGLGGIRTVLEEITHVTQGMWQIEYLAQELGPNWEGYTIHKFGARRITPQHFPICWLYVFLGMIKLLSLMRRGAGYHLLLPQDGVFNAVLAGLVGKLTGTPVICIDHADISLFTPRNSRIYQEERVSAISSKDWPWLLRMVVKRSLTLYWPSRRIAAKSRELALLIDMSCLAYPVIIAKKAAISLVSLLSA